MTNNYKELMQSCYPWLYSNKELVLALDSIQLTDNPTKEHYCSLEERKMKQRVCVENKLKPNVCPLRIQHQCSMYKEHKVLMDNIVDIHRQYNINTVVQQGEEPMGNRKKSDSIANFIKERLDSNTEKSVIESDLDAKLKEGVFKSKQSAKSLVTWYANFHKKRVVVAAPETSVA